jgi:hypothetical protein
MGIFKLNLNGKTAVVTFGLYGVVVIIDFAYNRGGRSIVKFSPVIRKFVVGHIISLLPSDNIAYDGIRFAYPRLFHGLKILRQRDGRQNAYYQYDYEQLHERKTFIPAG